MTTIARTESTAMKTIRQVFRQYTHAVSEVQKVEYSGSEIIDFCYHPMNAVSDPIPAIKLTLLTEGVKTEKFIKL